MPQRGEMTNEHQETAKNPHNVYINEDRIPDTCTYKCMIALSMKRKRRVALNV